MKSVFFRCRLPDFRFSARSGATISDLVRFTRNDRRRMERRNDSGMRENLPGSSAVGLRSGKKKFFTASIVILVIWRIYSEGRFVMVVLMGECVLFNPMPFTLFKLPNTLLKIKFTLSIKKLGGICVNLTCFGKFHGMSQCSRPNKISNSE